MSKQLDALTSPVYSANVPDKEGIWFSDLICKKAHRPRNAVFLRASVVARPLRAAVTGKPSGLPVFLFCAGSLTLSFAAHPV